MADATDSKSVGSDTVWVQVPPPAPWVPESLFGDSGIFFATKQKGAFLQAVRNIIELAAQASLETREKQKKGRMGEATQKCLKKRTFSCGFFSFRRTYAILYIK